MDCPVCGEKLREIERYGVSIDICPGCKGCWLDRGELEKIAALEESGFTPPSVERAPAPRDSSDHSRDYSKPKKRSSLLGDILGSLGGE